MLPGKLFFNDFFDDLEPKKGNKMMRCDIYEKDNKYNIELDVPGFKKDDIEISLDNGYLKISAEKKFDDEQSDKKYIHRERHTYQKCEREFYVGKINEEDIKAEFKNGTLNISVPKEEARDTKRLINID